MASVGERKQGSVTGVDTSQQRGITWAGSPSKANSGKGRNWCERTFNFSKPGSSLWLLQQASENSLGLCGEWGGGGRKEVYVWQNRLRLKVYQLTFEPAL